MQLSYPLLISCKYKYIHQVIDLVLLVALVYLSGHALTCLGLYNHHYRYRAPYHYGYTMDLVELLNIVKHLFDIPLPKGTFTSSYRTSSFSDLVHLDLSEISQFPRNQELAPGPLGIQPLLTNVDEGLLHLAVRKQFTLPQRSVKTTLRCEPRHQVVLLCSVDCDDLVDVFEW